MIIVLPLPIVGYPMATPFQPERSALDAQAVEALLLQLRRKEGGWVEWGRACQQLQQSGYGPQAIFEATGFEPIQQNTIIVAAQVYESLIKSEASTALLEHFWRRGSDVLYEFRQLDQQQRLHAAQLAWDKNLDADEVRPISADYKSYLRLPRLPDGFSAEAGDAVAYFCWKRARERSDLAERSRLIAQGLRFAASAGARQRLEQLLTDFTVVKTQKPPSWPIYRFDGEEDLPRVLPLVGQLPGPRLALPSSDGSQRSGSAWEETNLGGFQVVRPPSESAAQAAPTLPKLGWVALPGWAVIIRSGDPLAFLCDSAALPDALIEGRETLLAVVDHSVQEWSSLAYFVVERGEELAIAWAAEPLLEPIVGQLVLLLRPRRILDEDTSRQPWLED